MAAAPVQDATAIAAAAAATGFALVVLAASGRADVLQWFGGWRPRQGVAIGISFAADPMGADMAPLARGIAVLALAYSWTYMSRQTQTFDDQVLTQAGGTAAFSLTGDIFNMFVWFEKMGESAYALAGSRTRSRPAQTANNSRSRTPWGRLEEG